MAKLLSIPVTKPPNTVKVNVAFYDSNHHNLLFKSSAAKVIREANLPTVIEIQTVDLLTYYLFYKKRPGTPGYSSYRDIRSKYLNALVEFDGLVEFNKESICVTSANVLNSGTTERMGEAIGLSVVSQLHGLTEADWSKIKETSKRKTLDYEYGASDGNNIIRVEAKGTISNDNGKKTSSVSNHKADIEAKKREERSTITQSNALLYGTISVLDNHQDSIAQCWLLDPPLSLEISPERFRLLARLTAISDLISFLSPRSQLSAALQTRMAVLNWSENIYEFNGIPLRRGNGEEFATETYDHFTKSHNPWFANKSCVTDGPAGGQVFPLNERALLFIGMQEELLIYAIKQLFHKIIAYRSAPGTVYKRVRCRVPIGRFKSDFLPSFVENVETQKYGGYVCFELEGYLHYTRGGMVFGILPLPKAQEIG